jgi:hypothetical protein
LYDDEPVYQAAWAKLLPADTPDSVELPVPTEPPERLKLDSRNEPLTKLP